VDVAKSFKGQQAVDNVNLIIPHKSFCCILGPAGSGKTTLLRLIAGLEYPDNGKILIDGKDLTSTPPTDRSIAMVFEEFALYPHLTVFDNMASPLKPKKTPKDEAKRRVEEVASYLKIEHRLYAYPAQLSGGEKQRVAIGRALVKEASIILLDEPLIRLDYVIREEMRDELIRLQKDLEKTVIFATSDPYDALALGEITALMRKGKVEQVGPTDELYEKPANTFVGTYLGMVEMNLIPGTITSKNGKTVLEAGPFKVTYNKDLKLLTRDVLLGLRPEHISISDTNSKGTYKGEIILTEVIGSDTVVHLNVGLEVPLRVYIPYIYRKAIGEEVEITLNPETFYIFSSEDGRLLLRGESVHG
ncbi:MAG: ABC transporter ATP-binding protein, partial [Candidatus Bathyarchaeia archaeon]